MIHTLNLHNVVCELYFELVGKKTLFLFIFPPLYTQGLVQSMENKVLFLEKNNQ